MPNAALIASLKSHLAVKRSALDDFEQDFKIDPFAALKRMASAASAAAAQRVLEAALSIAQAEGDVKAYALSELRAGAANAAPATHAIEAMLTVETQRAWARVLDLCQSAAVCDQERAS